jgi:hypothetical protein
MPFHIVKHDYAECNELQKECQGKHPAVLLGMLRCGREAREYFDYPLDNSVLADYLVANHYSTM